MSLREDLKQKNFIITAELNPPRAADPLSLIENAKKVSSLVSAINITDNSGANSKMCSLVASHLIQSKTGIETIWQITCRDRNRLGLQSDLYGAWALGLRNILPLKGDAPQAALSADKCFDLNTEELITMITKLKENLDYEDKPVKNLQPINFCIGSASHPGMPDLNSQFETMKRRMDQGVEFFQTQICYEKDQINKFIDAIGNDLASKTILGVTPLKTIKQAHFMNQNVFGVTVPEYEIKALEFALGANDPESEEGKKLMQEEGLKLTKALVDHIKTTPLKGIHIMAIGQENKLDQIIGSLC